MTKMIQDIAPHKFNNAYTACSPEPGDPIMVFDGNRILMDCRGNGDPKFPKYEKESPTEGEYIYLFSIDEVKYFLAPDTARKEDASYRYFLPRELYRYRPEYEAFAAVTAMQLNNWYHNNRFCGRCGSPLRRDHIERMMKCDSCGNTIYPKISPVAIVGVMDGDRILMTKYASREYKRYALVAGFTEIGETMEETVAREVMEEVGLRVKNITYYKSQPWSFTDTLLMGFFCELDGSDQIKMDEKELSVAEWVSREEMDIKPDGISLTNEMMMKFKENR